MEAAPRASRGHTGGVSKRMKRPLLSGVTNHVKRLAFLDAKMRPVCFVLFCEIYLRWLAEASS
jgi:hypothetical protein